MSTLVTDQRRVSVGIGQIAVSTDPGEVLVAYGLGSCVGVTFYDPGTRSGGMVHVLLPDSEGRVSDGKEPARYADWGVAALLAELTRRGASRASLVIKVAGGAAVLGPAKGWVSFTIFNAQALQPPEGLFESSETGDRKTIKIRENDTVDYALLKALIQQAATA